MRVLIYGAGVIGCLYASLLAERNIDTAIYARGNRLEQLRKYGLRYFNEGKIHKANVKVIDRLLPSDCYDFIFLTVRENQLHDALRELSENQSPTVVTMVNSLDSYREWEKICGIGRILPAFPGAGGGFDENGILDAALTPRVIQPTTFAEIDGRKTPRTKMLKELFRATGIPYQQVRDMHAWQLCHLGMVVPLADAYYDTSVPEKAAEDYDVMRKTSRQIKRNLNDLREKGIKLLPPKMRLLRFIPTSLLQRGLTIAYKSKFGNRFMYQHAMKAPDEMRELHRQLYGYLTAAQVEE